MGSEWIGIGVMILIAVMLFFILLALQSILQTIQKIQLKEKYKRRSQRIMNQKNTDKKLKSYVDDVFFVMTKGFLILDNQERIFMKDIVYLSQHETYTTVNTLNETKRTPVLFPVLLENLPPNFVQCNDNQIVNMDWVKAVTEDRIILDQENLILQTDYKKFFKL